MDQGNGKEMSLSSNNGMMIVTGIIDPVRILFDVRDTTGMKHVFVGRGTNGRGLVLRSAAHSFIGKLSGGHPFSKLCRRKQEGRTPLNIGLAKSRKGRIIDKAKEIRDIDH